MSSSGLPLETGQSPRLLLTARVRVLHNTGHLPGGLGGVGAHAHAAQQAGLRVGFKDSNPGLDARETKGIPSKRFDFGLVYVGVVWYF